MARSLHVVLNKRFISRDAYHWLHSSRRVQDQSFDGSLMSKKNKERDEQMTEMILGVLGSVSLKLSGFTCALPDKNSPYPGPLASISSCIELTDWLADRHATGYLSRPPARSHALQKLQQTKLPKGKKCKIYQNPFPILPDKLTHD